METYTTPSPANDEPSKDGLEPLPPVNAPPWIQTMTGRRASSAAGVQTFSRRQSSPVGSSLTNMGASGPLVAICTCGQMLAADVQSSTPDHGSIGRGGRNRSSSTGAAANGTPRKTATPPSLVPRTAPDRVVTTTSVICPPHSGAPT